MENSPVSQLYLRFATEADAAALRAIYAPYVEHTAITSEYLVPSVEEFAGRIRSTLRRYPYLVACSGTRILGYVYAGAFRPRAAYSWSVETSIYVERNTRRLQVGSRLYQGLAAVLREQNFQNMYAGVTYAPEPRSWLPRDSVEFHRKLGFVPVAEFRNCGHKFGHWYNMIWMEKHIGAHPTPAPQLLPPDAVREIVAEKYGIR